MKNTMKLLSALALGIFLISFASAVVVYGDYTDASQTKTITLGDNINFNVDFFSMKTPMNMKVGLYSGTSLVHSFLDSSSTAKTYYHTYTYTATAVGTYTIKIIGTDSTNTDSEFLTLTVNPAPTPVNHAPHITTSPITQVTEGNSYSYNVDATDEDGDTLTYSLTSAPAGLSIVPPWLSINSATGIISGTAPPVSADTPFTVEVKVTDEHGATDTQSYTLTVKDNYVPPVNHAPVITSTPTNHVNEETNYYYDVQATDSDGDTLTYFLISSPSWLSINSATGLITGTAPSVTADTPFAITVRVSDSHEALATQSYTLTVKNIDGENTTPPVITVISPIEGKEYHSQTLGIKVTTNEEAEVTFRLDEGAHVEMNNPSDNTFTYTLHDLYEGKHYITFYATDTSGNMSSVTLDFYVKLCDNDNDCCNNGCKNNKEDSKIIPSNLDDEAKYYNQFNTANVVSGDDSKDSQKEGFNISILIYILVGVICLGIILVVFLLFRNLKR